MFGIVGKLLSRRLVVRSVRAIRAHGLSSPGVFDRAEPGGRGHSEVVSQPGPDRRYFLRGREIPYWFRRPTNAVRPMPSILAAAV